jgi:hypothetical protein
MLEQTTPEYKSRVVSLSQLLRSVHLMTMLICIPSIYGAVGAAVTGKCTSEFHIWLRDWWLTDWFLEKVLCYLKLLLHLKEQRNGTPSPQEKIHVDLNYENRILRFFYPDRNVRNSAEYFEGPFIDCQPGGQLFWLKYLLLFPAPLPTPDNTLKRLRPLLWIFQPTFLKKVITMLSATLYISTFEPVQRFSLHVIWNLCHWKNPLS